MKSRPDFISIFTVTILVVAFVLIAYFVAWGLINESRNRLAEGEVVDKQVYAGYADFNGKHGTAWATSYYLQIRGDKNGEIVTYWREVSESEYNRYNVGDWYGKNNGCAVITEGE